MFPGSGVYADRPDVHWTVQFVILASNHWFRTISRFFDEVVVFSVVVFWGFFLLPYTRARSRYLTIMSSCSGSLRERGSGLRRWEFLMVHGLRVVPVNVRMTLLHRSMINWFGGFFWFTLELWVLSAMPENFRHLAVHACLLFPLSFGLIRVQVHCQSDLAHYNAGDLAQNYLH